MFKKIIVAKNVSCECDRQQLTFIFVSLNKDKTFELDFRDNVVRATMFQVDSDDITFFIEQAREEFPELKFYAAQIDTRILLDSLSNVWKEIEMQKDVTRR